MNNTIKHVVNVAGLTGLMAVMTSSAIASETAAGIVAHSSGLGVSLTHHADQQLFGLGHTQIRGIAAATHIDDEDYTIGSQIEYEGDIESSTVQLGIDWYPFESQRFQSVFFSGGVSHSEFEYDGVSEPQAMIIGDTGISRSDNVTLQTKVERESTSPYVSVGWGNRLRADHNVYFQIEMGVLLSGDDADVTITADDPNDVLSAADIQYETDELQDDFGGTLGFASMGVTFRF